MTGISLSRLQFILASLREIMMESHIRNDGFPVTCLKPYTVFLVVLSAHVLMCPMFYFVT